MEIVRKIGGYSLGHADILRRAMGKKKMEVMERERQNFIFGQEDEEGNLLTPGAIRNGVDEKSASKIYDLMIDFANYAFNKSHSAAYAVVAYRTAWLKYYYPVEFMAALISSIMGDTDQVSLYIQECKRMGIEILNPDINESQLKFTVSQGKIRFGLSAVKNVGVKFIETLVLARKDGEFRSLTDFIERIVELDPSVMNKRAVESLIKCGALDSLGGNRAQYLSIFEKLIEGVNDTRKRNVRGQSSLFDMGEDEFTGDNLPNLRDFPKNILLNMEKEMVGIYISGHPLESYEEELRAASSHSSLDLKQDMEDLSVSNIRDGMRVKMAGMISKKKTMLTKNNNMMAFIGLEDLYGEIECIVFPTVFDRYLEYLEEDAIVVIYGKLSLSDVDEPQLIVERIREVKKPSDQKLYIKLNSIGDKESFNIVRKLLDNYKGDIPVYIYFEKERQTIVSDETMWVRNNLDMLNSLKNILGNDSVKLI